MSGPSFHAAAAVTALLLTGCGGIPLPSAAPSPPPVDYRQLAADAAAVQFKAVPLAGAQISELREATGPQLGEFAACLRTTVVAFDARGRPAFGAEPGDFLVLFEAGKVLSIRRAVVIDRCGEGHYGALPRPVIRKPEDKPKVDGKPKSRQIF